MCKSTTDTSTYNCKCEKEEMITIFKKDYDSLLKDSNFLDCLHACGVDNWSGYGDAQDMFKEEFAN